MFAQSARAAADGGAAEGEGADGAIAFPIPTLRSVPLLPLVLLITEITPKRCVQVERAKQKARAAQKELERALAIAAERNEAT